MAGHDAIGTNSLLSRIRDTGDREAWEEFVDRYAPPVCAWSLEAGLERTEAEAITTVLVTRFFLTLRRLSLDGARNLRLRLQDAAREAALSALADWEQGRAERPSRATGGAEGRLPSSEALLHRLEEHLAEELLAEAHHRVRDRVDPEAWGIYEQLGRGKKAGEIADCLKQALEAVHRVQGEVASSVCEELASLGLPDSSPPGLSSPSDGDVPWNPPPEGHGITDSLVCPGEFLERLKPGFPASQPDLGAVGSKDAEAGLEPGRFFAGHTLLKRIGRGGMGEVWTAKEDFTARIVALKVMRPELLENRTAGDRLTALRRFRNEMETAAKMAHRNLVPLYQAGEDDGRLFYTMEFVQGKGVLSSVRPPLTANPTSDRADPPQAPKAGAGPPGHAPPGPDRSLRRGLRWLGCSGKTADRAAWWLAAKHLEEASRGVAHAHNRGYLHRDLKPDNILVDESTGEARVTDFGLAKALGAQNDSRRLIGEYRAGSRGYMAPEQAQDASQATIQSDIYSLGATLYALLTGRPPTRPARDGDHLVDLAGIVQANVAADLAAICLKCLREQPEDRYATANDLADDLARFRELRPVTARPLGWIQGLGYWICRRPVTAALSLAVALLGLGLALGIPWATLSLTEARHAAQIAELEARQQRAHVSFQQARTARERGDWAQVLVRLDQALAAGYPDHVLIGIDRAKALRAMGNIAEWTRRVETLGPWRTHEQHAGSVLLLQAQLERFRGEQENSAALTRAALEHPLDPADELYARASLAETTPEAVGLLRDAARRDPFHYEAAMMLVAGLQLSGLRAEAREQASYAHRLFPGDGGFPIWLAVVAASESDRLGMERWLAEAGGGLDQATAELLAAVLEGYYALVGSINDLKLGDRMSTARSYFRLIQLTNRVRQLQHQAGKSSHGLATVTRCLPPSFHRAYSPLFRLSTLGALLTRDHARYTESLQEAARIHQEATLHFVLANLLAADERYEDSEKAFATAASLPAMIPGIGRESLLGAAATANLTYYATKDPRVLERAVDYTRRRVAMGVSDPFAADLLRLIAIQAADYELSRRIIAQVLDSDPTSLTWWAYLAEVELRDGRYFGAVRAADKVLAVETNHPLASEVKAAALQRARLFSQGHGDP